MEISKQLIHHYLACITAGWFDVNDLPPEDPDDYVPRIGAIGQEAAWYGDIRALQLGFSYLLAHPEIDTTEFDHTCYPYSDAEVREIIQLIYSTLWPGQPLPTTEEISEVRLIEITLDEWHQARKSIQDQYRLANPNQTSK